jgi:LacI family transcriptional regulator
MGANTTLKDIATTLGVSISTVSKALSNSSEISAETKNKVLEIAANLNYKPNFYASALRNNRSLILGILLPNLKDSFFLDFLTGITEEASKNDYKIMVYQCCNEYEKEVTYANLLADSNIIDGLIYSSTRKDFFTKEDNHIDSFLNNGIPVNYINRNHKTSVNNNYNETGFEIGRDCVKELLLKINNIHLSA